MAGFHIRIKEAFRFSGHIQQELVDCLGVHKSVVSAWMNGRNTPDVEKMIKIGKFLNVNPAWLAGYDVPREEFKIDDNEIRLLKKLRLLNNDGLEKTKSYIDDLLESPKYQKSEIAERDKKLA
jgi:transcriptional regulator with XRE-family HTH domain